MDDVVLCEVGDDEDRDNAEDCRRHAIEDLDGDQFTGAVSESVENRAKRQDSECDEQQRLSHASNRLLMTWKRQLENCGAFHSRRPSTSIWRLC